MTLGTETRRGPVAVQSYSNPADAEAAVRALIDAGFTSDDISVAARDSERAEAVAEDTGANVAEGTAIGAATGGILGGLAGLLVGAAAVTLPGIGIVIAGPLAAALAGAGAGGVLGGLAGALVGLGVSEEESRYYEDRFNQGDVIVAVAAGDRIAEARQILDAPTSMGRGIR